MLRNEISFQDLMGEVCEREWIVNLDDNAEGARRITVMATDELDAILKVEQEWGVTAISAYPRGDSSRIAFPLRGA